MTASFKCASENTTQTLMCFACLSKSLQVSPNYITHLYPKLICKPRDNLILASLPVHWSAPLWLMTVTLKPASLFLILYFHRGSLCASRKDNTCPILNGNVVLLGGCLVSGMCRCVKKTLHSQERILNSSCACGVCFYQIYHSTLFTKQSKLFGRKVFSSWPTSVNFRLVCI